MSRNLKFLHLILSAGLFIAAACAKISTPTGGPMDITPPVVLKSVPENSSVNFSGKELLITFDEYVVLDNINEKLMVSPPMQKKPRVFTRGKTIHVEYDEKLKDSTTYTFYFMDAIKDLNQGNILENYQFVFSTGPVIDSLSVNGNAYSSLTLEVPEKTSVLLYRDLTDSAVMKKLPDYLTRVTTTGYFRIDNIKEGRFRMYALKDDDNSKNYNRIEESFAFLDSVVTINSGRSFKPVVIDSIPQKADTRKTSVERTTTKKTTNGAKGAKNSDDVKRVKPLSVPVLKGEYQLILFNGPKKEHYLAKTSRDQNYLLTYILSLPPDTMKFRFSIPDVGEDKFLRQESVNRDTIRIWLTDSSLYNRQELKTVVNYPFTDSLGITALKEDTVPLRFIKPRATRGKVSKPRLKVESNLKSGIIKPGQKIFFLAGTPLKQPDTSKIKLYEIVEKTKNSIRYALQPDSSDYGKYMLEADLDQGKSYLLVTDSASFTNIYDVTNDSTGTRFSVKPAESYSRLILNLHNCKGECIIQLLNGKENIVGESKIKADRTLEFPLLEKGLYRLRVIYDLDGNGEWTTGDFASGRQPEPVSYYPAEIDIKEGWEAEQDWDLSVRNFKSQKLRQKAASK